ncbi:DUF3386 domain-containing protein [Lyngbya confervoides]|uniref:DUF3386 domain-containing protein n=1 Tax=Lyngbya confervoides BDU141951 TaxID=1574623 RepID=A0ABD4T573_9CYAN|nr:DUF3386 domain-containing protein [Lyngbya confervoides]MCM1983515.1 DUF3386 domain-containing protein [Lyngbya confervoides BDU141951]
MTVAQLSARDFFRAAYENRYTWDQDFPGYTTEVVYHHNGKTYEGTAKVTADLKAEVTGIEEAEALKAVQGQLWEIAIHRVRRSFEQTHGANTFSYGDLDESGAQEILMGGKSEGDRYKVANNEVSMVHRHIHGVVVTINTFTSHDTGEGYLSHTYDSVYHDPQTGEQKGGKSNFVDEYEQVGSYHILTRREIVTEGDPADVQEFIFKNIQLL